MTAEHPQKQNPTLKTDKTEESIKNAKNNMI